MTDADRGAFADMMSAVFTYYGKDIPSENVLQIYWDGLKVYDFPAIRHALGLHAKNADTGQFLPKIADVEKMLGGTTLDSALQAWAKVERAVSSAGRHRTVVFDDPLIHVVIHEMGGWPSLPTSTLKEWPFRQQEFLNRYRGYRGRSQLPPYPPRLVGISDGENGASGWKIDEGNTVLIGDASKAKLVLAGGTDVQRIGLAPLAPAAALVLEDRRP